MSNPQVNVALPCYEGYVKFIIWPEPESVSLRLKLDENLSCFYLQSISCYGLLSTNPILNPQLTGRCLSLPFFQGCRYAAVPATRCDGNIQVDILTARPESLVYHDHCVHIADLKVLLFFIFSTFIFVVFRFLNI